MHPVFIGEEQALVSTDNLNFLPSILLLGAAVGDAVNAVCPPSTG